MHKVLRCLGKKRLEQYSVTMYKNKKIKNKKCKQASSFGPMGSLACAQHIYDESHLNCWETVVLR